VLYREDVTHLDIGNVVLHHLLAGIVDQDIQSTVFADVLVDDLLAICFYHEIECETEAFAAILVNRLLYPVRAALSASYPSAL
jgi:hypothetical protein